MRKYKDFIESYISYTSNHESSEKLRKWIAISCIAGVLQRRVWLDFDYYKLYPNLYVFIVGPSGLVKKSTAMGIGVDLLRECNIKIMSDRVTPSSLVAEMRSAATFFKLGPQTVKQSAVFAYASELKSTFGGSIHQVAELLTDFFDCNPHDPSKPWIHKTGKDRTAIYGPCLNILAGTTPTWLTKMIPVEDMEGGFASRVLFVVEQPSKKHIAWPGLDDDKKLMKQSLVHDLHQIMNKCVGQFRVHSKARDLFTMWYENHMTHDVPRNTDPKFSGYMGRKGDTIRKLAMIRACSLGEEMIIETDHILWAAEQLEELEKTMFDALRTFSEDDLLIDIQEYVRARGKVNLREIIQVFSSKASDNSIGNLCVDLRITGVFKEIKLGSDITYEFINRTYPTEEIAISDQEISSCVSDQENMEPVNESDVEHHETSDTQQSASSQTAPTWPEPFQ